MCWVSSQELPRSAADSPYGIPAPSRSLQIHGAAAGKQSELFPPISTHVTFAYADSDTSARLITADGTASVTPTGRMTMFSGTDCCETVTMQQRTAQFPAGETGFDGTIGFGGLTAGTANIDGGEGAGFAALNLTANQGLHYVSS